MIVTPFEVIKIRLQNQMGTDKATLRYHGPIDAVIKTVKNEVGREEGDKGRGICRCRLYLRQDSA